MFGRLLCGSLIVAFALCDDCRTDFDEWTVDYLGHSGQFRLVSACDDKTNLKIKMISITELDVIGRKTTNKVTGFASQDFVWDSEYGEDTKYEGQEAILNTFRATLSVGTGLNFWGVPFNLTTILFLANSSDDNENLEDDHHHHHRRPGTLKWNVDIVGWPFLSPENKLELGIDVQASTESRHDSDGEQIEDEDDSSVFWFNCGFVVDCPTVAEVDGDETKISVIYHRQNEDKLQVYLLFPSFERTLYYDPYLYYVEGNNSGNSNGSDKKSVFGLLLGVIAVVWFVH